MDVPLPSQTPELPCGREVYSAIPQCGCCEELPFNWREVEKRKWQDIEEKLEMEEEEKSELIDHLRNNVDMVRKVQLEHETSEVDLCIQMYGMNRYEKGQVIFRVADVATIRELLVRGAPPSGRIPDRPEIGPVPPLPYYTFYGDVAGVQLLLFAGVDANDTFALRTTVDKVVDLNTRFCGMTVCHSSETEVERFLSPFDHREGGSGGKAVPQLTALGIAVQELGCGADRRQAKKLRNACRLGTSVSDDKFRDAYQSVIEILLQSGACLCVGKPCALEFAMAIDAPILEYILQWAVRSDSYKQQCISYCLERLFPRSKKSKKHKKVSNRVVPSMSAANTKQSTTSTRSSTPSFNGPLSVSGQCQLSRCQTAPEWTGMRVAKCAREWLTVQHNERKAAEREKREQEQEKQKQENGVGLAHRPKPAPILTKKYSEEDARRIERRRKPTGETPALPPLDRSTATKPPAASHSTSHVSAASALRSSVPVFDASHHKHSVLDSDADVQMGEISDEDISDEEISDEKLPTAEVPSADGPGVSASVGKINVAGTKGSCGSGLSSARIGWGENERAKADAAGVDNGGVDEVEEIGDLNESIEVRGDMTPRSTSEIDAMIGGPRSAAGGPIAVG